MSSVALRVREHRARQKAGRAVFAVECSEHDLGQALIAARLLDPALVDDKNAIASSLNEMVRLFCGE